MAASQFTIYTASDQFGPGFITGNSGSLIPILDACLVNGYSGKPAAGWTKPFGTTGSYTAYTQASGSLMTLFVNDNNPNASLGREAHLTGWIGMTSLSGSGTISASNVGTGYGQFPLASQGLSTGGSVSGSVICRKSSTADNTNLRNWIIAADAWTVYMWILTGDGYYTNWGFGEFYSLAGPTDRGKVFLYGRNIANNVTSVNNDGADAMVSTNQNSTNNIQSAMPAHFIARGVNGGFSTAISKKGAADLSSAALANGTLMTRMDGVTITPNPVDNSFYLTPLYVWEPTPNLLRGRFRGLWHIGHPTTSFTDGQIIQGSGALAGKSFMVIKIGFNSGMWGLEVSNTVETN